MDARNETPDLVAIESLFAVATPPRAGSTGWYDACAELRGTLTRAQRERFGRSFHTEVYGDEVGLIVRVRGDGCGAAPWSVDRAFDTGLPLRPQVDAALRAIGAEVESAYVAR